MRGSPVIRGLAVVAALLLLLVPLARMTSGRAPAPSEAAPQTPRETSAVAIRLASSSTPFTFSISHLGAVIWEGRSSESRVEKEFDIPYPPEGIDLLVSADWPGSTLSALEVSVARDGAEPVAQTIWGEHGLAEVLTFR